MDQELMNTAPKTLYATAGGVIKAVHLDEIYAAIVDLTYRTNAPFVVELTMTAFTETPHGSHAESATWLLGRDMLAEALASGQPLGQGDVAMHYDRRTDQLTLVFTDGNVFNNPEQMRGTHRLVVDAEPIHTFLRHAQRLVPTPVLDVDQFLDEVLGEQ